MTWDKISRRALLATALAMGLGTSAAVADQLATVKSAGVIKIGIFQDFPPFASLGSSMKVEGYDTEMADKIAAALGVKAELVSSTGQNRIPFLTEGKVDALLSIGFSDERAQAHHLGLQGFVVLQQGLKVLAGEGLGELLAPGFDLLDPAL